MFALYQAIRELTHAKPESQEKPEALSYAEDLRQTLYLFESRLRGFRNQLDALTPLSKTRAPSGSKERALQETASGLYRILLNCLLNLPASHMPTTDKFNQLLDMLDNSPMLMGALQDNIRNQLYAKQMLPEGISFESFCLALDANQNLCLMFEFRKRYFELSLTATREIPLELPTPTNIREARALFNKALAQMKKHLAKLDEIPKFSSNSQEMTRKKALGKKLLAFAGTLSRTEQELLNKHWPSLKSALLRPML